MFQIQNFSLLQVAFWQALKANETVSFMLQVLFRLYKEKSRKSSNQGEGSTPRNFS